MKDYTWAKGYTYAKIPIYWIHFCIFGHWIRIGKKGYIRKRQGAMITKPEIWKIYEKLLKS